MIRSRACLTALLLCCGGVAQASTVNVLWYTGGIATSSSYFASYGAALTSLVAAAPSAPGGNTWTMTTWDSGPMPVGSFNVLVTASPQGGWTTFPNYTALNAAAGSMTLGDRVMLTGQDADYHYINYPGPTNFDGPKGFLLNAINWAGSGTGMGAVFLGGVPSGFVAALPGQTEAGINQNSVLIPGAVAGFPINTNLTSAGLSNWSTSSHTYYTIQNPTLWTGINTSGSSTTQFVTIVSAATADQPISAVPEPGTIGMMGLGLAGFAFAAWKKRRSA